MSGECLTEWINTEIEMNGYMSMSISMGLAYDSVWFEINDGESIELSEEYYFNYEQGFMYYMFESMARGH